MQDDQNTQADVDVEDVELDSPDGLETGGTESAQQSDQGELKRRLPGQEGMSGDEDGEDTEEDDELTTVESEVGDANDGTGMDKPLPGDMDPQE